MKLWRLRRWTSGLTLNLKTLSDGGVDYIYGVSVASEGSGYSDGDLVDSDRFFIFGLSVSGNSNTYGLGINSSTLSTGDNSGHHLQNGEISSLIGVNIGLTSNVQLLSNNDYLYFVYQGTVTSNTTITGGKYLIKMYGTEF